MIMPTECECCYMAGVLDGEGCLGIYTHWNGRSYFPSVEVNQTDQSWLDEFQGSWGGKVNPKSEKRKGRAFAWVWRITGEGMVQLLNAVKPYLRLKREQAELLLQLQELIDSGSGGTGQPLTKHELEIRRGLWKRCKLLNRTGPRGDQLELELKSQAQLPLIK